MDGDPLIGEPSQANENVNTSLAEMFMQIYPFYMVMGMTPKEFWYSNTRNHKAYREAYEIRKHNDEWDRWRQGAYFYDALVRVAPVMRAALSKSNVEPGKYPEEPWPLTEKEAKEREERAARERYNRMREKLMSEAKEARKRRAEEAAKKEASENG